MMARSSIEPPGPPGRRRPAWLATILAVCLVVLGATSAFARPPETMFLGASVDHFVDPAGTLTFEEVVRRPELFIRSEGGRTANRGRSTTGRTALWLRFAVPPLDPGLAYVLAYDETRVIAAQLYRATPTGVVAHEWSGPKDLAAGRPILRQPVFRLAAADVDGQVLHLRIETARPFARRSGCRASRPSWRARRPRSSASASCSASWLDCSATCSPWRSRCATAPSGGCRPLFWCSPPMSPAIAPSSRR
jgi:hypothetical protein